MRANVVLVKPIDFLGLATGRENFSTAEGLLNSGILINFDGNGTQPRAVFVPFHLVESLAGSQHSVQTATEKGLMSFKPGDVVQLKSGGPEMTVTSVSGDEVRCIWFANREASPSYADFLSEVLETPRKPPAPRG